MIMGNNSISDEQARMFALRIHQDIISFCRSNPDICEEWKQLADSTNSELQGKNRRSVPPERRLKKNKKKGSPPNADELYYKTSVSA